MQVGRINQKRDLVFFWEKKRMAEKTEQLSINEREWTLDASSSPLLGVMALEEVLVPEVH